MTEQTDRARQPGSAADLVSPPRFKLVSGSDQVRLARLATELSPHFGEIARLWQGLYLGTFVGEGVLDGAEFLRSAREELASLFLLMGEQDPAALAGWFETRGREMARRGLPFAELVESLHLFEEAVLEHLRGQGLGPRELLSTFLLLDRLSHQRIISMAIAYSKEQRETTAAQGEALQDALAEKASAVPGVERLVGLLGSSPQMQKVYARIQVAARERASVLLTGESGTGKELAARAIHLLSGDPPDRFIAINCAAIPREIFESELFGHRRGSYSGALADREGLFRAADGGTLYLDEITELAPEGQAKLLRAVQERAVRQVGSNQEVPVDVRVVASTNRDPARALADGLLRRDLYYRLQTFVVALPSLRERRADVPLLARHFCERWKLEHRGRPLRGLTSAALARLTEHDWPGNVRELEAAVFSACSSSEGPWVDVDDLPETACLGPSAANAEVKLPVSLRDAEREAIARALAETGGNKTRAAELLGISRKQLHVKVRDYGL